MSQSSSLEARLLRALGRREYTRSELARKGRGWGYPAEEIQRVLERLSSQGAVDDGRAARNHVETRLAGRPRGRMALRAELRRRGVDQGEIDRALETVDPDREEAAAREVARRKLRSLEGLEPVVIRRRLAGTLQRRGFPVPIIRRLLDELDP